MKKLKICDVRKLIVLEGEGGEVLRNSKIVTEIFFISRLRRRGFREIAITGSMTFFFLGSRWWGGAKKKRIKYAWSLGQGYKISETWQFYRMRFFIFFLFAQEIGLEQCFYWKNMEFNFFMYILMFWMPPVRKRYAKITQKSCINYAKNWTYIKNG